MQRRDVYLFMKLQAWENTSAADCS